MGVFKSCKYIEHGVVLDHGNVVRYCTNFNPRHGGRPVIYADYCGEKIDWKDFFSKRREDRQKYRDGSCVSECKDCVGVEDKEWDDEDYIDYILFTSWVECNSKCVYCSCHCDENVQATKEYSVYNLAKDMIKNKVFKNDAIIDFAGGEPTIDKEFNKLLDLFLDNNSHKIIIHTNAINFSKAIQRGIKIGKVDILVSMDGGSKEVHKEVKGVDSYDKVWKNLKDYTKVQPKDKVSVRTKYIIVPGTNDSKEEINIWLKKSAEIGIKGVVLNLDHRWVSRNIDNIPKELYDLIEFTKTTAKNYNMNCQLYGDIFQIKREVDGEECNI